VIEESSFENVFKKVLNLLWSGTLKFLNFALMQS